MPIPVILYKTQLCDTQRKKIRKWLRSKDKGIGIYYFPEMNYSSMTWRYRYFEAVRYYYKGRKILVAKELESK